MRPWLIALIALLALELAGGHARAEDAAPCALDDATCKCAEDGSCWAWELLYSGPEAVLGVRGTLSAASEHGGTRIDGAVLTTYATERYVTSDGVSGHVMVAAALGGGTAGTDGSASASAGFGWRASPTPTRGAFVRAGVSGLLVGSDRSSLSILEPLQLKTGLQVLESELLVEAGLSLGFVAAGRFAAASGTGDALARSGELGSFFTAHFGELWFTTSFLVLPSWLTPDGVSLGVARISACGKITSVTVCGDLLYANGTSQDRRGRGERPSVLHSGVTVGLSP